MDKQSLGDGLPSEATVYIRTEAPLVVNFGNTAWQFGFLGHNGADTLAKASVGYLTNKQLPNGLTLSGPPGIISSDKFFLTLT
jgi:hypothetical protein